MIAVEGIQQRSIRRHYQLATLFYRLLWGPHIHHGLWSGSESIEVAQIQLIDALADLAEITPGQRIIDIGCGMGGSAIYLAKSRGCDITGVTISSLQRHWAAMTSRFHRAPKRPKFLLGDAEKIDFAKSQFDCLWSVECTEHLFDKERFFMRAAPWIKTGGRIALCVWFAGERSETNELHRKQCEEVCRRFVCPSLGTRADYARWLTSQGFEVLHNVDWTKQVEQTWEICQRRVNHRLIRYLARTLDREQVEFLDGFKVLLDAYRSGAMEYGALVAKKL